MANADIPSLEEIAQLTRSELILKQDDSIRECGRACIELLPRDPDMCLQVAYQHLHDVPYNEVKTCWRRLYADSALRLALEVLEKGSSEKSKGGGEKDGEDNCRVVEEEEGDWVTKIVKILDMALILTGAPGREELVELWFAAVGGMLEKEVHTMEWGEVRPAKRRKLDAHDTSSTPIASLIPETFPTTIATPPFVQCQISRVSCMSLQAFQAKIGNPDTQTPIVIEGAMDHWPAVHEQPWNRPEYLLEKTLGGRRLVPVEIGRSYTDQGWGQKILSFGEFMREYMFQHPVKPKDSEPVDAARSNSANSDGDNRTAGGRHDEASCKPPPTAVTKNADTPPNLPQTGYLAQHDLFAQIPSLRADISIPDYCYTDPTPQPTNFSNVKSVAKLEEPLLNAWFGPANTISPLHTDPYHNILAQVVGYKYVRLYAPDQTENLYPRSVDESGIDMSNTSEVDLDVAMKMWPDISCWGKDKTCEHLDECDNETEDWEDNFQRFREAKYVEGVLSPGDCLYVPVGWWHYVRSLTPSFSVSFWFN